MVGRSGKAGERFELVTANALRRPARIKLIDEGRLSNIISTLPAIKSMTAGGLPL